MTKKLLSIILTTLLVFSLVPCSFASTESSSKITDVQRIDYEDGSYAIVTITEEKNALTRAAYQTTGEKHYDYYESGTCVWTFTITGTFTYDGSTAKASNAKRYTTIHDSSWRASTTSAYASGASIKGSATMKKGSLAPTINLTLTCSPDGTLS